MVITKDHYTVKLLSVKQYKMLKHRSYHSKMKIRFQEDRLTAFLLRVGWEESLNRLSVVCDY